MSSVVSFEEDRGRDLLRDLDLSDVVVFGPFFCELFRWVVVLVCREAEELVAPIFYVEIIELFPVFFALLFLPGSSRTYQSL